MPLELVMGLPPEETTGNRHVADFVFDQQEMEKHVHRIAREQLGDGAEHRKKSYDVPVKKEQFEVGEWVWYYYPRRYTKRSPKWQRCYTGPYLIVRSIPPVSYVLQRTPKAKPFVVHADKLKKCYSSTPSSWLLMVSWESKESSPSVSGSAEGNIEGPIML